MEIVPALAAIPLSVHDVLGLTDCHRNSKACQSLSDAAYLICGHGAAYLRRNDNVFGIIGRTAAPKSDTVHTAHTIRIPPSVALGVSNGPQPVPHRAHQTSPERAQKEDSRPMYAPHSPLLALLTQIQVPSKLIAGAWCRVGHGLKKTASSLLLLLAGGLRL